MPVCVSNNKYSTFVQPIMICIVSYISSGAMATYLQIQPYPFLHIALFLLEVFSANYIMDRKSQITSRMIVCFLIFSVLFSVALVLGYHIITDGPLYSGKMDQSYISPYSIKDIIGFILIFVYVLSFSIFVCLSLNCITTKWTEAHNKSPNNDSRYKTDQLAYHKIKLRPLLIISITIFIAYIPYLLVYYPGLEFGDSFYSIAQATGQEPWSNHHPVVYTLFIKCCIKLSTLFGLGITGGRALYSIVQMAFMAVCFSYMICWITKRCRLNNYWAITLIIVFALTPYVASYSIAMWKDPVFSISIMMLTLLLADLIFSDGYAAKDRSWVCMFIIFALFATFLRSNGVFAVALIGLVSSIMFIKNKRREKKSIDIRNDPNTAMQNSSSKGFLKSASISLSIVVACLIITGPVYVFAGIELASKTERYGILLNQMARVVATNGSMSESDQEYMDEILPLERYSLVYTPCNVDPLKWDENFDSGALRSGNGFFEHWLSMFVKNPVTYFESWELQTFGWWAVNQPIINAYSENIASGVPRDHHNLLGIEALQDALPLNTWSVPAGWTLWLALYTATILIYKRKTVWIISLIPTFGLFATLMMASPLCYWPRYAAAAQFLIPFYCALLLLSARSKVKTELRNTEPYNTNL